MSSGNILAAIASKSDCVRAVTQWISNDGADPAHGSAVGLDNKHLRATDHRLACIPAQQRRGSAHNVAPDPRLAPCHHRHGVRVMYPALEWEFVRFVTNSELSRHFIDTEESLR